MDENSTLNKLILYYYNELGMADSVLAQRLIDRNFAVHEEYEMLKETISRIEEIVMEPSDSCIDRILFYNRSV